MNDYSMRGSGVYAREVTYAHLCETEGCTFDGVIDTIANDWGSIEFDCPGCGTNYFITPEE